MDLFPLLSLGVQWSSEVPALRGFLPQFPSPAHELPKFIGNQGRLHLIQNPPLLFGPASQGGLWTLKDQGAGNPSVRSVTSPMESCWWWMRLFLVQFCVGEGISPPERLDGVDRAFLPGAPKDGVGWT